MPKLEIIKPTELKKMLDLSNALDLDLLCTISDAIITIGVYDTWKSKKYECSQDDKRQIFDMINDHYKARNDRKLDK